MFVYTFWEPRENIPFYLQLCMETWKKFLPTATIVLLDYKNIGEFLDVRELGLNLFSGKLTLPQIADAIRVALLAKHGGVWLDIDTIILSSNAEKYFMPDEKHRTVFFGDTEKSALRICFINTPPNSMCMNLWREVIKEKIWNLKSETIVTWDFFGNKFIDDYVRIHADEIKILDMRIAMPQLSLVSESVNYQQSDFLYYFLHNHHLKDISADMLLLHNSWTPPFFKQVSSKEFFYLDCTLVNVLAEALDFALPPPTAYTTQRFICEIKFFPDIKSDEFALFFYQKIHRIF